MKRHGFVRVAAFSPPVSVAHPARNAAAILSLWQARDDIDVAVFPELCLTGYTAADLFAQQDLLHATNLALQDLAAATRDRRGALIVGLPMTVENRRYNVAAVLCSGSICGFVPKQYLPTYQEFYESRWFHPATGDESPEVDFAGESIPFGIDLLFDLGVTTLGIEICEDLWVPTPPSGFQATAGAELLVNLSASNEVVGKVEWRRQLVQSQSGRCIAGYVYASAGPTESTTDLVFGGHCLIAESGSLLGESARVGDGNLPSSAGHRVIAEIDLDRIRHDRQVTGTFAGARRFLPFDFRKVRVPIGQATFNKLVRPITGAPFVPRDSAELDHRCTEIFAIQTAGLAKRVSRLPAKSPLVIGVSGGLDSTLALLVAVKACDAYGWPRKRIHGVTMPGFGTTQDTRDNSLALMNSLQITHEMIDIRPLCWQAFQSLQHPPLGIDLASIQSVEQLQHELNHLPQERRSDLVFENVQARIRTFLLMSRGFVLGTGDMSEQALGWSTYNGDHMSMYNVNTSVPKTLVKFLVRYAADNFFTGSDRQLLHRIASQEITPELLPLSATGEVVQRTEEQLGPYELHDFFLYQMIRNGFGAEKILFLASQAKFTRAYSAEEIADTLRTFYRRFFANQFKRSCVPDGPKVGTVSLSPRGDWRMPSDADPDAWLDSVTKSQDR